MKKLKTTKTKRSDAFSEVEQKHDNLVVTFEYASVSKSIIYAKITG